MPGSRPDVRSCGAVIATTLLGAPVDSRAVPFTVILTEQGNLKKGWGARVRVASTASQAGR
jgi:hypothetical protein